MKKKVKRGLALIMGMMMAGSLLVGCGDSSSPDSSGSGSGSSEASESTEMAEDTGSGEDGESSGSKRLVIGSGQTCDTLDPVDSYNGWYAVRFGIGQTLTKMNDDLTISGWLAEDGYEVSEDNKTWTFTIKDGVTFSNGDELTAEMAKTSIENVFENGSRGEEYFTPDTIEADGQTLTITAKEAEPILANKLADPLFTIIDTNVDLSNVAKEGPIGTGPFKVKSFDTTTKECVVEKNEDYWGGDVKVDEVDFIYTEDQTTLTMGLQSGDFDAVYNISMTDIETFESDDSYTIEKTASGRTTHGFMNQNGVLGDQVLREAILRMLDKESYCENLLNGQYVAGKTLITSAANYGYDELTDPNEYDPDSAEKLLDDAGYEDTDGDGFRETPDGEKINLQYVYYTGRPEQQIVVEATQTALADVGIQVTPKVMETQAVIDALASGEYDMLCMSINVLNCADPENHMVSYFKAGGTNNSFGYDSGEFNSLMDQLTGTADPDERVEIVKEAEQILLDDAVCIYYCYPIMNFVMKNNVSGITSTPADYYWISEETDIQ